MIDEKEQEFEGVVKILRELQHVKAPDNFEANLFRKINSGEIRKQETEAWFLRFFAPRKFIPSAALAVIAVLILFVIRPGSNEIENPFNIKPKLRKDRITTTTQLSEEKKVDSELQKMINPDKVNGTKSEAENSNTKDFQSDKSASSYTTQNYEAVSSPGFSNFSVIDKSGLNFRPVILTKMERMELNKLKANLMKFMKENKLK